MKNQAEDIETVEALLRPGGLLKDMEVLDEIAQNEEVRHAKTASMIFARLFRNSVVAASSPDALTEFLRHPYWDGNIQKPKSEDREGILRALIRFHVRNEAKARARKKLHTWLSAGRELIARGVPANEVQNVIAGTTNDIAGLRDAFSERRKAINPSEPRNGQKTHLKLGMRLPVPRDSVSWRRFNEGERYLVYYDGHVENYIPEKYIKSASGK